MKDLIRKKEWMPEGGYEESIKNLRTSLQLYGKNMQTIMLTSTRPKEGKSLISFYLARSLAQSGKKTILLEADIRNPVLMEHYEETEGITGLSQYLCGQSQLKDIIYGTDTENLNIILSCPSVFDQVEFFDEELCQEMLRILKNMYDYVIIDTASVETAMDAVMLAQYCDGTILVLESGAVSRRAAQKAQNQLESTGAKILGVVLNKVTA